MLQNAGQKNTLNEDHARKIKWEKNNNKGVL